jgi:hypothetical protein
VKLAGVDKTVCVSSPCVQSALEGSSSADEQGRGVLYGGSRQRRKGWRQRFFGGKTFAIAPSGVRLNCWCGSRGPGESHLGKIGYLLSQGFSATSHPAAVVEVGFSFVDQRDAWYQGRFRGSPAFYVKVRQPTQNAAGLHVSVCWRAEGTAGYVDSVEAGANAFRVQLTEWWDRYREEHPWPGIRG